MANQICNVIVLSKEATTGEECSESVYWFKTHTSVAGDTFFAVALAKENHVLGINSKVR
jgi:hypothetical protein